jgi:hypothetical protein
MSALDYLTEPTITCPDTDANDDDFVRATSMIGDHVVVEEFRACGMHLLSANFGFREITDDETPMLKLIVPLLDFHTVKAEGECDAQFLAKVELEAENIMGSYGHDSCV